MPITCLDMNFLLRFLSRYGSKRVCNHRARPVVRRNRLQLEPPCGGVLLRTPKPPRGLDPDRLPMAFMAIHKVVLIPGDGIGPEVSDAVRQVLSAAGAPVEFVIRLAGQTALDSGMHDILPEETTRAIREHHIALKGPCTTPVGSGF